jgi:hypothetical protein
VLDHAAQAVRPTVSLQALQSQIQIDDHMWCGVDPPPVCNQVVISAEATTPSQADRVAAVVAHSYVAYVAATVGLWIDEPASVIPGATVRADALETGELGALCGALIGATGAIALGRRRRALPRDLTLARA